MNMKPNYTVSDINKSASTNYGYGANQSQKVTNYTFKTRNLSTDGRDTHRNQHGSNEGLNSLKSIYDNNDQNYSREVNNCQKMSGMRKSRFQSFNASSDTGRSGIRRDCSMPAERNWNQFNEDPYSEYNHGYVYDAVAQVNTSTPPPVNIISPGPPSELLNRKTIIRPLAFKPVCTGNLTMVSMTSTVTDALSSPKGMVSSSSLAIDYQQQQQQQQQLQQQQQQQQQHQQQQHQQHQIMPLPEPASSSTSISTSSKRSSPPPIPPHANRPSHKSKNNRVQSTKSGDSSGYYSSSKPNTSIISNNSNSSSSNNNNINNNQNHNNNGSNYHKYNNSNNNNNNVATTSSSENVSPVFDDSSSFLDSFQLSTKISQTIDLYANTRDTVALDANTTTTGNGSGMMYEIESEIRSEKQRSKLLETALANSNCKLLDAESQIGELKKRLAQKTVEITKAVDSLSILKRNLEYQTRRTMQLERSVQNTNSGGSSGSSVAVDVRNQSSQTNTKHYDLSIMKLIDDFDAERNVWLDEKRKVVAYQQRIEIHYQQLLQKYRQLEHQVSQAKNRVNEKQHYQHHQQPYSQAISSISQNDTCLSALPVSTTLNNTVEPTQHSPYSK